MSIVEIIPLPGIPEVEPRHDLARLVHDAVDAAGLSLQDGDVLVVSSKIVSKADGLREFYTSAAHGQREDLVRSQSHRIVAERSTPRGITRVSESVAGPVLAGAGVDESNVGPIGGALVLPADPDLAARTLYAGLLVTHAPAPLPRIGIVISDTAGRPWRHGQVDFALGACGLRVLDDLAGAHAVDVDGRELRVTARAVADEIAAAADLVKGKTVGVPAAVVRGLSTATIGHPGEPGARSLVRCGIGDWFGLGAVEAVRASLGAPPGSEMAQRIGIPAAGPEPLKRRLERVVALALEHASPVRAPDVIEATESGITVRLRDDYQRGYVVARLEAALHSEGLGGVDIAAFSGLEGAAAAPSAGHAWGG